SVWVTTVVPLPPFPLVQGPQRPLTRERAAPPDLLEPQHLPPFPYGSGESTWMVWGLVLGFLCFCLLRWGLWGWWYGLRFPAALFAGLFLYYLVKVVIEFGWPWQWSTQFSNVETAWDGLGAFAHLACGYSLIVLVWFALMRNLSLLLPPWFTLRRRW